MACVLRIHASANSHRDRPTASGDLEALPIVPSPEELPIHQRLDTVSGIVALTFLALFWD